MKIIELTYTAHGTTILDGLSAEIPEGRITALVGPNGAGKTTLFRCLSGDLVASTGLVQFGRREIDLASDYWKTTIGVVPDSDALFDELTVREQLSLAATLFGVQNQEQGVRVDSLLELSNLTDKQNALGSELSAGMRKRLAVALSLIHAPRLLLFDEPLNAMDYASSETFFQLLRYLRTIGRTVLISGHSLQALARVADRIVEMKEGKVLNTIDVIEDNRSLEKILPHLETVSGQYDVAGRTVSLPWMAQ